MQIGLICAEKNYCLGDYERIHSIFGDTLTINQYAVDDSSIFSLDPDDEFYVIVMVSEYLESILPVIPPGKPIIYGKLIFSRAQLSTLAQYPPGTKALLVSKEASLALEAIAMIYRDGIKNIEFHPYYPGMEVPEDISLAITPGYPELAPPSVTDVLDIGTRTLDVQTINDIMTLSGYTYIGKTSQYRDFVTKMLGESANTNLDYVATSRIKREFDFVMRMMDIGILVADEFDIISATNDKTSELLGTYRFDLIGHELYSIIPRSILDQTRQTQLPATLSFKTQKRKQLKLSISPMLDQNEYIGTMVTILPKGEDDSLQHRLVSHLSPKGHRAKYSFENLVGNSPALVQAIDVAKKMACTDAAVLITGESGTGKELFAHSIHSTSHRAAHPFVAINCAAIPDTLLESELFGYEEGAFSGAKRGGKIGLFEIADKGTIFLDEINSMSTVMQVKLLRVIQEKEFMRVGGNTLIPVDVRIISSTNQDLLSCVSDGTFRRDLYYRVSTLPIHIPPLRERGSDILALIDAFCQESNYTFRCSSSAQQALLSYHWPGNIRELRNCVEYLGCLDLAHIDIAHLPSYINKKAPISSIQEENFPEELYRDVAKILFHGPCGRHKILATLVSQGHTITEAKIRSVLQQMSDKGWVTTVRGRNGTSLTEIGIQHLLY